MPTFSIRGVNCFVHQQGDGIPLLLLHGFTGSHENWLPYADLIVRHGYQMIAPDVLGHGSTESPSDVARYSIAEVAEDIVAILQEIGIDATALLGYSMGGRLALYLAHHYPQLFPQVILESASPGLATIGGQIARKRKDRILAKSILASGVAPFVEKWESLPMWASQNTLPDNIRDALRTQRLNNNAIGLANSLQGMGTGIQPSLWDNLKHIDQPILLMTGDEDAKFTQINEFMAINLPNVTHECILGAGHTVHLEKSGLFWEKAFEFLRKYE